MTPPTDRIPVLIVAGFLGAGKTTFIRDLIPRVAAGPRAPYVILNDFLNAAIIVNDMSEVNPKARLSDPFPNWAQTNAAL